MKLFRNLTSYFQYGKYATQPIIQNAHDFLLDFYEKNKKTEQSTTRKDVRPWQIERKTEQQKKQLADLEKKEYPLRLWDGSGTRNRI